MKEKKKERKKACKTALYDKIKERIERGDDLLIGAHTQNTGIVPFNSNNVTQDKKKVRSY